MKLRLPKVDVKAGDIPEVDSFYPGDWVKALALLPVTIATLTTASQLTSNPLLQIASVPAVLLAAWLYDRHVTRRDREGWLFDKPWTFGKTVKSDSNADWEMTRFLNKRGVLGADEMVTKSRSAQYNILKIPTFDPEKLEKHLGAIASKLGIDKANLLFYPVYSSGTAAILYTIEDAKQWDDVSYKPEHLEQGKLVSYIGDTVTGKPMIFDRRYANHFLVSGMTDSGKTEVMCNDMESMRRSGIPVQIYIIDPKDTAQLQRQPSHFYTTSVEQGVSKIESLLKIEGDARRAKYAKAGCDNWFEYREKVDREEPAIFVYIDELSEFLEEDLMETLEKGDHSRHKRAGHVFTRSIQKQRSVGIFFTVGLQHPEAATMPTKARMNFGAQVTLSVANRVAANVAGAKGAEKLPIHGGMIFQYQKRKSLGRGAYLKAA